MAGPARHRPPTSEERWAQESATAEGGRPPVRNRLSTDLVVATALELVRAEGYDALTMRRVAAALGVVPGALYVHVRDKATLDDLMVGRVCSRVELPVPDAACWRDQVVDVCSQLRDQYVAHPGLARAALTAAPRNLDTLRVNEGAIAIVVAGGVPVRTAAWAVDAALLYVNAFSTVVARRSTERGPDGRPIDLDAVARRFESLPVAEFPLSSRHARDLLSGDPEERFRFSLERIFDLT